MLGLWLVGFVLLLYVVWRFQRAGRSLSQSVLLGLVLGMSYAWVLSFFQGSVKGLLPWVHLVGYGYAGLLKMIAMPLAVVSVLSAIVRVGKASSDRAIAFWVIAILMAMTAIAALDGVIVANLFDLDASAIVRVEQRLGVEKYWINWHLEEGDWTLRSLVFMVFPKLIASALSGLTDMVMISLMIVAMFFALAALAVVKKDPETGAQIVQVIEGLQVWVMALVRMIIRLTPYGVLALMIQVGLMANDGVIWQLVKFFIACYMALALMLGVHALAVVITGRSPIRHFKKIMPVLRFAFISRSSAATTPLNIEAQIKRLKVHPSIANFSASFGAMIGQNGCAGVFPAVLAGMIMPSLAMDAWSVIFVLVLVIVVAGVSFAVAGVGGGATFAAIIVLSLLDMPLVLVGLVISIEPLIDMMRTLVNVSGTMTAGVVTQRFLGRKLQD